jgi:hypothetical protein
MGLILKSAFNNKSGKRLTDHQEAVNGSSESSDGGFEIVRVAGRGGVGRRGAAFIATIATR